MAGGRPAVVRLAAWGAGLLGALLVTATVAGPARPLVAAHRGGSLLWPENTLTAFRGAIGLGVDLVELDVHSSKDGEVVVIHDPTLDRTTTGRGPVQDRTWAELGASAVKGSSTGERLPRLSEVLRVLGPTGVGLLLEIKVGPDGGRYAGIEGKVLEQLRDTAMTDRTTIMAFEWDTLERLRALAPAVRLTGLLGRGMVRGLGGVRAAAERLRAIGANDLGIERTLLSPEAIEAARANGLTIGVWTVNDPDEIRGALAAGVDYVTTDRPDLALTLRGDRGR